MSVRFTLLDLREARARLRAEAARAAEALRTPHPAAMSAARQELDDIRQGYRRISGSVNRDLTPLLQDRAIEMAWWLYDRNLFAKRLVNWFVEFPLGDGFRVQAADAAVQPVLDAFMNDPVNRLQMSFQDHARELSIFGEQVLTAYVNPVNGRVRLATIDPYDIEQVVWGGFSPDAEDIALPLEVRLKAKAGRPQRTLRVIRQVEEPDDPEYGYRSGDCFYFAINKAKKGTRGRSDIFAAADYIDGYDQLLFSALERFDVATRVFEDVTLEGFTEQEIEAWLEKPENRVPPRPLSKRAHNERVKFQLVSPQLGAYELEDAGARLFRNFVLGGMGFPEHWFAQGGETNLATAVEQGTPTFRMLTMRQQYLRTMLEDILNFVLDRAIVAGVLPETINRHLTVQMPEMSVRDATKLSGALNQVTFALQAAASESWLTPETAARIFAGMVSQLGFPVDAERELAELALRPRPEEVDYERRRGRQPEKPEDAKNPAREEAREEVA